MQQLSTHLRTHMIILKDKKIIHITKTQYEIYKSEVDLKKHNDFITINDIDTGQIVFEGRCSEILEFKEKIIEQSDRFVICNYGNRHPLQNGYYQCNCKSKYKFNSIDLQIYMRDVLKKMYIQDVTEDEKRDFYKIWKKTNLTTN